MSFQYCNLWPSWTSARNKQQASFTSPLALAKPAVTIEILSSSHRLQLVILSPTDLVISAFSLKSISFPTTTSTFPTGSLKWGEIISKSLNDRHSEKLCLRASPVPVNRLIRYQRKKACVVLIMTIHNQWESLNVTPGSDSHLYECMPQWA